MCHLAETEAHPEKEPSRERGWPRGHRQQPEENELLPPGERRQRTRGGCRVRGHSRGADVPGRGGWWRRWDIQSCPHTRWQSCANKFLVDAWPQWDRKSILGTICWRLAVKAPLSKSFVFGLWCSKHFFCSPQVDAVHVWSGWSHGLWASCCTAPCPTASGRAGTAGSWLLLWSPRCGSLSSPTSWCGW